MTGGASIETPVLIVGGGPVGFAIALDLAVRGIRTTLVERDAGTALELLAKAGTLNERTMEYCRWLGVAEAVANIGFPDDHPRDTVYCTSLNGFLLGRDKLPSTRDRTPPPQTPEMLRKCPQHLFDPILANAVKARGMTEVLYDTTFLSLSQDADGVTVQLAEGADARPLTVRAQYVVGCDGAGSAVRKELNIPFEGKQLDYSVSAMIRIDDLDRYHRFGRAERFMFVGPEGTWANLTVVDGHSLYRLTMVGSEDKLDPATLDIGAIMNRAMGCDGVNWEVLRVVPWRRSQFAADRFGEGRVLLAGDSAHTTSPTGGHGLNTGLGDARDASWMLEALVHGWGGEHLLEAYSVERRRVALRNSSSSTRNYAVWVESDGRELVLDDTPEGEAQRRVIGARMSAMLQQEWHSLGIGMGYRYDQSPIIVPDGSPPTPDDPSDYVQTSRPGHRAPHAWLADGRSTIDLFGDGFVLLALGDDAPDVSPLAKASADAGVPLRIVLIREAGVAELYARKLVLVRPDGMVAWRGDELPEDCAALIGIVRGGEGAHDDD